MLATLRADRRPCDDRIRRLFVIVRRRYGNDNSIIPLFTSYVIVISYRVCNSIIIPAYVEGLSSGVIAYEPSDLSIKPEQSSSINQR